MTVPILFILLYYCKVQYIGRTNNFDRRQLEQMRERGIRIQEIEGLNDLSFDEARGVKY